MKLNPYELEAERQYRFDERMGQLHPDHKGPPTAEQKVEIDKLIEPDMEALRNFEYEP